MTSTERWLPVLGYEGLYEVSDCGNVRSVDRMVRTFGGAVRLALGVPVKAWPNRAGYMKVKLWRDGTTKDRAVHTLVLESFVGPRPEGLICCHNDGNPGNNVLENLRWDDYRSNNLDAVRHGTHAGTRKKRCPAGHPYSGDNLVMYLNRGIPRRRCRTCSDRRGQGSTGRLAPPPVSAVDKARMAEMRAAGETYRAIGNTFGVHESTAYRVINGRPSEAKEPQP